MPKESYDISKEGAVIFGRGEPHDHFYVLDGSGSCV